MLCYRCQHRLEYIESTEYEWVDDKREIKKEGRRPRLECGGIGTSKYICYMFQPIKPIIMNLADSEKELKIKRSPFDPPFMSARSKFIREADVDKMKATNVKDGYILEWVLHKERKENKNEITN